MNIPFVGGIIKGITGIFSKREDRKKAIQTGQLKIQAANDKADNDLELSDAEWEAVSVSKQDSTWKDEYITIVITAPFVTILVGAILGAYTGDMSLLDGTKSALTEMKNIGIDLGGLMQTVVLAAVGLKVWRAA